MTGIRKPFKYRYWNVTLWLIILNTIIFALDFILERMFGFNLAALFGLNFIRFLKGHYYFQPVTYMFIHGDMWHLLFNMLALFFFGFPTEKVIGSKEFILLYLLCGILIGLTSLGISYAVIRFATTIEVIYIAQYSVLIGASGAIYSVLLTYAVCFPTSKIYIWGIIPVPAPLLILIYVVIEFVGQFKGSSNIAHYAHLLGFFFAWLYLIIRMGIRPIKVWKDAYRR